MRPGGVCFSVFEYGKSRTERFMSDITKLNAEELAKLRAELQLRYDEVKARGLNLDMTRGKPAPEQLDLAGDMLALPGTGAYRTANGTDARNYGGLDGIPEAKKLFAAYMECKEEELIVGGNSSLNMMYDSMTRALQQGVPGGRGPWNQEGKIKFLCPSPGYDRHFAVCEHLGIEMIVIDMKDDGPDMDSVEKAVQDPAVKGVWCVPKYSNPTGCVYSDSVVDRFARMKTAAPDFRIFWDNAYAAHHLGGGSAPLKNILRACEEAGNPDRALVFGSTSKISFAGSGVALLASSRANIESALKTLSFQTIGPDKLNQLRHVLFFKDTAGIAAHMDKHAAIIKPKFDLVNEILERDLGGRGAARWTKPQGGYFVSLDLLDGCASRAGALAGEAGVKFTKAGATFPYGKDPRDVNIRIAPTLPSLEEIKDAMEVLTLCVQLATAEKLSA